MSYLVQQSDLNDKPVLGVSINYRLSAFGFLDSEEVRVRYCIYEHETLYTLIGGLGRRKYQSGVA
jgi:carboxylesterase type B